MKIQNLAFLSVAISMLSVPAFASSYDIEVETDPDTFESLLMFSTKKTMPKRCNIPVEKLVVKKADMLGNGQIDIKTGPIKGKCMMAFGKYRGSVKLNPNKLITGKYRVLIDGEVSGTVRLRGFIKN